MMHAPDLVPSLDDALRALDGAAVNGVMDRAQLGTLRGFLNQLDDVRDVPGLVLDQAQAAHLEGAYQAGVRCADEAGHVLVVSLPAFLELFPAPAAPARDGLLAPFGRLVDWFVVRPTLALAAALWLGAFVALFADHDAQAAGWLAFAGAVLAISWFVARASSSQPNPKESQHG